MYVVKVDKSVCIMSALNWLNPKEASILLSRGRPCTLNTKSCANGTAQFEKTTCPEARRKEVKS